MALDENEGEEGLSWQQIVKMIGKILQLIAEGFSVAGACAGAAADFGVSAAIATKLYNKHRKEVEK